MKYFFVQNDINEWYIVPVTLKAAWEDMVDYGKDKDKKDDFDLMFGEYLNGNKSMHLPGVDNSKVISSEPNIRKENNSRYY